jgi:hypothetical protein
MIYPGLQHIMPVVVVAAHGAADPAAKAAPVAAGLVAATDLRQATRLLTQVAGVAVLAQLTAVLEARGLL